MAKPEQNGGQSRASKKRARAKDKKKRQQQQQQQQSEHEEQETVESHSKPTKLSLFDDSDDDDDIDNNKHERMATQTSTTTKKQRVTTTTMKRTDNLQQESPNRASSIARELRIQNQPFPTPSAILFTFENQSMISKDKSSINNETTSLSESKDHIIDWSLLTSEDRGRLVLESLLSPSGITAEQFYAEYWETKPLLISKTETTNSKDDSSSWYEKRLDGLLSKSDIETLFDQHALRYGRDINVTNYCDSTGSGRKSRVTLDLLPPPTQKNDDDDDDDDDYIIADPQDIWSNFESGCSLRLLCPQKHLDTIHTLLSTLESEFGCHIGANAYLTPGNHHQGFAPHYDDIEAFVLQLEGSKHWKVYPPRCTEEILPRTSSLDFDESDVKDWIPVMDTMLHPGDVLYMPRGWIHQAVTTTSGNKEHSLHLTVSAMQNWAWCDLLDLIVPEALEVATLNDTSLRMGLPRKFLGYMGVMYEEGGCEVLEEAERRRRRREGGGEEEEDAVEEEAEREEAERRKRMKAMQDRFREEAKERIRKVCSQALSMIDSGCDQIGKRFLSDRLPPSFTPTEQPSSSSTTLLLPNTQCRLARPGIARLVLEDDNTKAILYHCVDNSREYHDKALEPLEFESDDAPALEMLLRTVAPSWVCIKDLIHESLEDKMEIVQVLCREGILVVQSVEDGG